MHLELAHSISAVPAGCDDDWWQNHPWKKLTQWESEKHTGAKTLHTFPVSFSCYCANSSSHLDRAHPVSSVTFFNSSFTWPVVLQRHSPHGKRELKKKATINSTDAGPFGFPPAFPCLLISSHYHTSGGSGISNTWAQVWDLGYKLCFWLSCWSRVLSAWITHVFLQLQARWAAAQRPLEQRQQTSFGKGLYWKWNTMLVRN